MDIRPISSNMVTSSSISAEDKAQQSRQGEQNRSALSQDQAGQQLSMSKMHDMVGGANQFFEFTRTRIKFHLHEGLERYYVEVQDAETGEMIREIPPEHFLNLIEKLHELAGLIVDEQI